MKYFIIPLCLLLLLCSCGNNSKNTIKEEISVTNGTIIVSPNAAVLGKLKTEKIEATTYQPQFSTTGVVRAIPTSYAEIATPFAGRIIRSFIRLGQTVAKGDPLFELSSPSFFETSKVYFSAKQEMDQALKNLRREQDLLANSVGVKKEVEEAQVNYQLKKQDYDNARSALKVFQVNPDAIKLGEPLIVRSPISGKVVKNNIVLGQYIKEDSEPLAVIANLRKVWVVAQVKEKDLRLIERLQKVDISLSASPDEVIKGVVFHISEMLDEDTRSVEVIIECNNSDGRMKPFMYGAVRLTDKEINAVLIPTSAIMQQEDNNYVIIALGGNRFRRTPVSVGNVVENKTVITAGIRPGEEIVTEGAFYLLDAK